MARSKKCVFISFCILLLLLEFIFYSQWIPLTAEWKIDELFIQHSDLNSSEVSRKLWDSFKQTERRVTPVLEVSKKNLPECPQNSPKLIGPLNIDLEVSTTMDHVIDENPKLTLGGHFKPAECVARQRIAIILPFRNRETHLKLWLYYLHPILQRQQADYGVYVVEQYGKATFNRAKLLNVGFNEAQKEYDYNCFVFSDIDIIPMNDRNLYNCASNPRHMANAVDKFGFRLPYDTLFGGVVAFSKDQFLKVNGYSNVFWGWGGEDDELYRRVVAVGMKVERPDNVIAQSKMIRHNRDPGNESNGKRFLLVYLAWIRMHKDGLNSLQYSIRKLSRHKLYTKISVDIECLKSCKTQRPSLADSSQMEAFLPLLELK